MRTRVVWKDRMSLVGEGDSGHAVLLDAEESVGGDDRAARPMELIAIGLAGCTAMDVISILRKKKQDVTAFEVTVDAVRAAEHPKVITSAVIEYRLAGRRIEEAALVRAIGLSAEKYCPAQAMLGRVFPMRLVYRILDEDGQTVLHEGEYRPAAADPG